MLSKWLRRNQLRNTIRSILAHDEHLTFPQVLDEARPALYSYFAERLPSATIAQAFTLKVQNLCMAKHHFRQRSTTLLSRPFGLIVDPANVCNLACPGCVHSQRSKDLQLFDWQPGLLRPDCFTGLMKRNGAFAIQTTFCNYGEPLTSAHTPAFIQQSKSYLNRTMLSTNFTLPKFDAEAYVHCGLDYMVLSIDGATQATYQRYRKKGNLEIAFHNIAKLVAAKKALGKGTPVICWQYLAFEHNAHEIPLAKELAAKMGIDQINIAAPFDVSWDDPDIRPAQDVQTGFILLNPSSEQAIADNWPERPNTDCIAEEFHQTWQQRAVDEGYGEPAPLQPVEHSCHWLYKNMVVDANARVLPCCAAPAVGVDLTFDTLNSNSFNSPKYRQSRRYFREGAQDHTGPHCTRCEWDQETANVDRMQIEQFFRSAGHMVFDSDTTTALSVW